MKLFRIFALLLCSLLFASNTKAATKTYRYSGVITSQGQTKTHKLSIPYSGTLKATLKVRSGGGDYIVIFLKKSGTTLAAAGTSGTTSQTISVTAANTYTIELRAININSSHNYASYSVSCVLTYELNSAPVISSISATPSSTTYGNPVTVNVSATDVDGNLSYVRFTKGSSNVNDTTAPYAHTYRGLPIGTHTVTAYAVDTKAASDDASVSFKITGRSITVRAKSGVSRKGTTPTRQGLELVSGTLASGKTLTSLGFSVNPKITSSTAKGSYVINVAGNAAGYSVTRRPGSWFVTDALNPTTTDTDGDHLPNWVESSLSSAGFSISSIKNSNSAVAPGTLCPPNSGAVYLCPGQPLE